MYQVQYFFQRYLLFILSGIVVLLIGILIFVVITRQQAPETNNTPSTTPAISQAVARQLPFKILTTSPTDGATNVYSGEIVISFTTDNPILTQDAVSVDIQPTVPNYWKLVSIFPTKEVKIQVYGGLKQSTTYTVTVRNKQGVGLKQWSFTTNSTPPTNSSREVEDKENQELAQDFPLYKYLPYSTGDFDVGYYSDKLTLPVTIRSTNPDQAKQELFDWVRSHGVDPSTHTFNYTYVK